MFINTTISLRSRFSAFVREHIVDDLPIELYDLADRDDSMPGHRLAAIAFLLAYIDLMFYVIKYILL